MEKYTYIRKTITWDSRRYEVRGKTEQEACETLADLVARGLLAEREGRLAPTGQGWLLGNELYGALWGLAEGEVACARCRPFPGV